MTNEWLHPVIILYHVDFTDAHDSNKMGPTKRWAGAGNWADRATSGKDIGGSASWWSSKLSSSLAKVGVWFSFVGDNFFFSHIYATFALGSSNRIVLVHATCL